VVCRHQLAELARCEILYTVDFGVFSPCIDNYTATAGMNHTDAGLDWLGIGDQTGTFTQGTQGNPSTGNPHGFVDAPVYGLIHRYMSQNERIILCPSDYPGGYVPNEVVTAGNGKFSYTMNAVLGLRSPERILAASNVQGTRRVPSNAPLFVEEHPYGINNDHREGNFGAGIGSNPGATAGDILISRHGPFTPRLGVNPHNGITSLFAQGSTNIGFADGHAEGIEPSFGIGAPPSQPAGFSGIPNNIVGLMNYYGVKFEVAQFTF